MSGFMLFCLLALISLLLAKSLDRLETIVDLLKKDNENVK